MTFQKSHFINGKWVAGLGPSMHSTNPATGHPVWHGHSAINSEVDAAIAAARDAFPAWRSLSLEQRIAILNAFAASLKSNIDAITLAISEEVGKPLWESRTEVEAMIGKIGVSIDAYNTRCPEVSKPDAQTNSVIVTRHRPHGVLAVLGPFNFPGHLPNGHIVPALLAGNTVVFKPSEHTPRVAELTIRCWEEAKLPSGVLNMIQGGGETGSLLSSHNGIDGLLFTGSWNVGSKLSKLYGSTPEKILALEMGGNNPLVIGDIKDLNAAAYITIQSAFLTAGQRCTCARRLIIPRGKHHDAYIDTLLTATRSIVVGPYTQSPEPFIGPVISAAAAEQIVKQYENLIALGGKPLIPLVRHPAGPAFLSPSIVDMTGVKNRQDGEIFGPITQLIRVDTFAEAIEEANNTSYGLAAGILSDSPAQYKEFLESSTAGVINWNTQTTGARSNAPFGGTGHSGNNRPSAYYAADYCSYPTASVEIPTLSLPKNLFPGVKIGG